MVEYYIRVVVDNVFHLKGVLTDDIYQKQINKPVKDISL